MIRLLVADDNQVNRRVVEKILQRAGHHATLVGNGEEALDVERLRDVVVSPGRDEALDLAAGDVEAAPFGPVALRPTGQRRP